VCAAQRRHCFRATLLGRYEIDYFLCDCCGLLQTESPYWLAEAYEQVITDEDTGLVARNIEIARKLACVLYFCFDRRGRYLDMAGGYGMLTRLMRDTGFDYYWSDQYCENLFARGFERMRIEPPFTAITAFEVLEHVVDPLRTVQEWLHEAQAPVLIFSTELYQGSQPPQPGTWDYYALSTGQHISFYSLRTLQVLAQRLSLHLCSVSNLHMMSRQRISPRLFRLLTSRLSHLLFMFIRRRMPSRTLADSCLAGAERLSHSSQ
jgi:hypothetical protein